MVGHFVRDVEPVEVGCQLHPPKRCRLVVGCILDHRIGRKTDQVVVLTVGRKTGRRIGGKVGCLDSCLGYSSDIRLAGAETAAVVLRSISVVGYQVTDLAGIVHMDCYSGCQSQYFSTRLTPKGCDQPSCVFCSVVCSVLKRGYWLCCCYVPVVVHARCDHPKVVL